MKELQAIQQALEAPKGQYNKFGKYAYRSCEDILSAVKPLLAANNAVLTLTDDIVLIGERYYVKATATLKTDSESFSVDSFARESESKKGMDAAQITGAASSYARKYALNALFCIDDTKDPDATNKHDDSEKPAPKKYVTKNQAQKLEAMVVDSNSNIAKFLEFAHAETFEKIPADRYSLCMAGLMSKLGDKK